MFSFLKDAFLTPSILTPLVSAFLKQYKLDKLGSVTSVDLNTSCRTLKVTLQLEGETSPIELECHYAMAGEDRIEILEVNSSRAWIATLVNDLIPADKKRFTVPSAAQKFL